MKKLEIAMILGLAGAICCAALNQTAESRNHLETEVLRLHILANSDSIDDQALKLKVRDQILSYTAELLDDPKATFAEVENTVAIHLDEMEEVANSVITEAGYDYIVTAELTEMEFADRTYDTLVMPAGTYETLRISIGEGAGENWWCVMYPALCVPSASEVTTDSDIEETAFSEAEQDLLVHHEQYIIKLKCVTWLEKLFS